MVCGEIVLVKHGLMKQIFMIFSTIIPFFIWNLSVNINEGMSQDIDSQSLLLAQNQWQLFSFPEGAVRLKS